MPFARTRATWWTCNRRIERETSTRARIGVDAQGVHQHARTITQKIPTPFLPVARSQPLTSFVQQLDAEAIEIVQKTATKSILLQQRKRHQRRETERGKRDEEAMDQAQAHAVWILMMSTQ